MSLKSVGLALSLVLSMGLGSKNQLAAQPLSPALDPAIVTAASGGRSPGYSAVSIELPNPRRLVDGQIVTPDIFAGQLPPLTVTDPAGRTMYPVAEEVRVQMLPPSEQPVPRAGGGRLLGRLRGLIREVTGSGDEPIQVVGRRVTFLLIGDQPLTATVSDSSGPLTSVNVNPIRDAAVHDELLTKWWSGFTSAAKSQIGAAGYPPRVEMYLVAMLSGRLGLPLPDWYLPDSIRYSDSPPIDEVDDPVWGTLRLIAGGSGLADQLFRQVASGVGLSSGPASLPLPPQPNWLPDPNLQPLITPDSKVERLAMSVPPECFYLRFGSFENYLWFKDLTEQNGGDLARLVTIAGLSDDGSQRIENQLSLATTELTRTMGPNVIADQAIIGTDLYLSDGGSIGVIMQATQPFLLRTSLAGDRAKRARGDDTITLEENYRVRQSVPVDINLDLSGVSFLSSGDGTVRSFLAERDGIFFISNSETLMARFLTVAGGDVSLGQKDYFRYARTLMPTDRDDTVFAYFSPDMLRNLVSPKSMIEFRRRLITEAEFSLVHLARLANRPFSVASAGSTSIVRPGPTRGDLNEGGIDGLRGSGFLPDGFGNRPDGTGLIDFGVGEVIDSLRGRAGTLLPIADVEIESVTPAEAAWYDEIRLAYSTRFAGIDPIMVGVHRGPLVDDGAGRSVETLDLHAEVAPFSAAKYGKYARYLGPPTTTAMTFAPDDIISLQAHVAADQIGPPTHLFAAVKDSLPPAPSDFNGLLNIYRSLKIVPGYLGAWPQPGMLDRLPLGLGVGTPVGPGMSRLIGGVYRYADGAFSLLSFDPQVIESSLPFLAADTIPVPAQIRINSGDLRDSRIGPWISDRLYEKRPRKVAGGSQLPRFTVTTVFATAAIGSGIGRTDLGRPSPVFVGGRIPV